MSSTIKIHIPDMQCAGCVSNIEKALQALSEVESVELSLTDKTAVVISSLSADTIRSAIQDAGYKTELVNEPVPDA